MAISITITSYDPAWAQVYQREVRDIRHALGSQILAIEHIGSTAVPGLAAKPIVDVMAGVTRLADATHCIEPLRSIGYEFAPEVTKRLGLHDDRLFVRWSGGTKVVHLHVTEYGGRFWEDKLLFRDFLRTHPETAREYEALKRALAPQFSDGPGYSEAKTAFIHAALARARKASA